jgi:hypothetical protein
MLQRRKQEAFARAHGTSRRASGRVGENVARSGGLIRAILETTYIRASLEGSSLVTRCGRAWEKARLGAPELGG